MANVGVIVLIPLLLVLMDDFVASRHIRKDNIVKSNDKFIQSSIENQGIDPEKDNGAEVDDIDLRLTEEQNQMLHPSNAKKSRQKRKAISATQYRWSGNTIPYEYNANDFTDVEKAELQKAMDLWAEETCIKFRKATSSDKNKILFQTGTGGCNSWMGMVGGTQPINLSKNGCRWLGVFLHEVGHAIGLVHEHQLPIRDDYIKVKWENVDPKLTKWFEKYSSSYINDYGTKYDYASIMHYGPKAFSGNGGATMVTVDASDANRMAVSVTKKTLSFTDVKVVNRMYNCAAGCVFTCSADEFMDKHCKCITPKSYYAKHCVNKYNVTKDSCDKWASAGECANNPGWMSENCRKSCDLCPKYGNYL